MPTIRLQDARPFADVEVRVRCGYPDDIRGNTIEEHVDGLIDAWDGEGDPDLDVIQDQAEAYVAPPCGRSWVPGQVCLTCVFADVEVLDWDAPSGAVGFRRGTP